jgi:hypothetical protein
MMLSGAFAYHVKRLGAMLGGPPALLTLFRKLFRQRLLHRRQQVDRKLSHGRRGLDDEV